MLDFLFALVLIGGPLAVFLTRHRIARLPDQKKFFTIVGLVWLLVVGLLGRASDTAPTGNAAPDGDAKAGTESDTGEFRDAGGAGTP